MFSKINMFFEIVTFIMIICAIIMYNIKTRNSVVETMINFTNEDILKEIKSMGLEPALGFCKHHEISGKSREESCNKLTKGKCNKVGCCVWTNKNECVAGSRHGPLFTTKKGVKNSGVNSYYHQGKYYG
jgi:hypothetical protein